MDYSKFSRTELIEILDRKRISYSSNMSDNELINLLIQNDNNFGRNNNFSNKELEKPLVRGEKHETILVFGGLVLSAFIQPFIFFASFFYWPLIRYWYRFIGEYIWTWVSFLNIILLWIGTFIYSIIFFMTFILIPLAIVTVFFTISATKGLLIAVESRTMYVEEFVSGNFVPKEEKPLNNSTPQQNNVKKEPVHTKETITSRSSNSFVTKRNPKDLDKK